MRWHLTQLVVVLVLHSSASVVSGETDLTSWAKSDDALPATVAGGKATLGPSDRWAYLHAPEEHDHVELETTFTILDTAKRFDFFGQSWSVWPDPTFGDRGFEVALNLRADMTSGYRVQLSHKYQEAALVKYPQGGYLQSVPCVVKLNEPQTVRVHLQGNRALVHVDGKEVIRYDDQLLPLSKGRYGVGTSSQARVMFEKVALRSLPAPKEKVQIAKHVSRFSARKWLGGRLWVFDGNEPILLLPAPESSYINNVKLRPGYKPQLSWNSHWDIQNQGAFPEGENKTTDVKVTGTGPRLTAQWTGKHVKDRFVTRSSLVFGFDEVRGAYTYDVESELEVLPGTPFHFRYGFDFEHHTPLDPFQWQNLVVRREGGALNRRPVYPIDPGPMYGVYQDGGLRMWFGRHNEKMLIAPAVEYDIQASKRKLNTAVCAAFYDTGVSFEQETAPAGTKVRVKYRYTGYPAQEAESLYKESTIYDSWMLDPTHHYIFADDWPRLTFREHLTMDKPWAGKTPFMTGHNQRPTYELAGDTGVGSGFAMKLGPGAFGKASLTLPKLAPGRYVVSALCKAENAHGPGGRMEMAATQAKTGKVLSEARHFVGNGSFDWKRTGFVFDMPMEPGGLSIAFGNSGTGAVLFAEVEFKKIDEGTPLPEGVAEKPAATPAKVRAAPTGAIADYRMEEGAGLAVHDYAVGPFGRLELANLNWAVDDKRPALKFTENISGRAVYQRASNLDRSYLSHPGYQERRTVPAAIAGQHGGGFKLNAFTLATWIKPAAEMGKSTHGGKGDVIGLGARRFILGLYNQKAPYRLGARLNVNDEFVAPKALLEADRWVHVAMTGEPHEGKWKVRLHVDGAMVHEGVAKKLDAPLSVPPSLILGAEIFYLHDAFYRGLIGRTLVFDRALSAREVAELRNE